MLAFPPLPPTQSKNSREGEAAEEKVQEEQLLPVPCVGQHPHRTLPTPPSHPSHQLHNPDFKTFAPSQGALKNLYFSSSHPEQSWGLAGAAGLFLVMCSCPLMLSLHGDSLCHGSSCSTYSTTTAKLISTSRAKLSSLHQAMHVVKARPEPRRVRDCLTCRKPCAK